MGRSPCCEKAHTNKGAWTKEEDQRLVWSLIAGKLPGRTDNEIKNYWNTHIKRKLIARGIDPQTHRPLAVAAAHQASSSHDNEQQTAVQSSCSPEGSGAAHSSDDDSALVPPGCPGIDLNLSLNQPSQQPSSPPPSSPTTIN
ncbi:hypothetical protein U9M48_035117 [Paspalum notatum var. saurae]|uniref:Uncharacterized protein n=1 Tax=Paspalum notatum var. saurae TaxID=547442 RepID=A0AAQ3X9P4_PASNO